VRADVYLWAVRLFKTRALSAEALRDGRVSVGGTLLKASKELKVGEVFVLRRTGYQQHFEVLGLPRTRVGAPLVAGLLREVTPPDELERRELWEFAQRASAGYGGLGRPTKKDRRDLNDFME
jgi:ribosome-associated heat shock protein Hsp15